MLGATDNIALDILVNNERALRIEPTATADAPNIIGGHPAITDSKWLPNSGAVQTLTIRHKLPA